jgi:dihydropteroate synthase
MKTTFKPREWHLAHDQKLMLGAGSVVMGILNVTPDSFSDGGKFNNLEACLSHANKMLEEGASILDIGGESTRPGAEPISDKEEQTRVLPIIKALAAKTDAILCIDTYRASTAKLAIEAGAHIINDVWGFQKDPEIASVAAELKAGCCAMHTGRERTKADDVMEDQHRFLTQSIKHMKQSGIADNHIVLDPGFGFAKDADENIELLDRLDELHILGYPLLIGASRKRFIGHFTGQDADNRDIGTSATSVVARMKGAQLFRVHDVATNIQALAMADAVIASRQE